MKQEDWLRPYFREYSGRFALYLILSILTVLCAGMLMFTSGFLISKSATMPYNILLVYVPIVGVRTFSIGRSVIHYVERLVGHDAVLRILSKMRVRLYRILEPQALFISSRYRTGDILGALADDIEQLQNVYIRTVFPSLVAVVLYAAAVIGISGFDVTFAGLVAIYIFILVFVLPYISWKLTKGTNKAVKRERNGLYQRLTDAVMGIGDWVISGRQGHFLHDYENEEATVAQKERKLRAWSRWRMLIGQLVVGIVVVSMLYWSGNQAAAGQIDITLIAAFTLVVFPIADAFLPVSEAIERIPGYQESLNRLDGMSGSDSMLAGNAQSGLRQLTKEEISAASKHANLSLVDVAFRYNEGESNSIQSLSLDIPQGKKIAIIGRSGAGKSTLLKLIQGALVPTEGSVTVNGISAHQFGDEIAHVIAVLNQRPHLFDTTLANNIALGHSGCTKEEMMDAVERAQLSQLVASLPAGLNTPMRETGQRFSGGERQRVALARVLLQNTPILILDEPTVGLDPRTERELLSTIFHSTTGKTLVWVTHHLVGAEQMDEIIFMEQGKIIMQGSHAELMEREPRYRHLYELDKPQ